MRVSSVLNNFVCLTTLVERGYILQKTVVDGLLKYPLIIVLDTLLRNT